MIRSLAAFGPLKHSRSAQESCSNQEPMLKRSRTQIKKSRPANNEGIKISVMLTSRKSIPILIKTDSIPLLTIIFRTSSAVVKTCQSESMRREKLEERTSNMIAAPTSPTIDPSVIASIEKSLSAMVSFSMLNVGVTKAPPGERAERRRAVLIPNV